MTSEPDEPNEKTNQTTTETTEPVTKLLIDRPSDFRFHAAYLVYSDAWDRASSPDVKLKLNEIIEGLSEEKLDYEAFYRQISQYRAEFNPEHFSSGGRGPFIETQRKKDWRRREERASRNKRHGR